MKIRTRLLSIALLFCFVTDAYALDAAAAVKVTPFLRTTTNWDGNPIVYPRGQPQIVGIIVELAVGGETGWHEHPVPSFALILEGTLEVTLRDGRRNRLGPGEALVEVVDTAHNGRNVGDRPLKLVVFYASEVGKALTIPSPAPP